MRIIKVNAFVNILCSNHTYLKQLLSSDKLSKILVDNSALV